ncbi:hypothetical protein RRF57_010577 [Xylaria bambusicola]|uniref:Uncharacterized protein n=1 Tax=Xylaria bambusicola TaxID=326684 RepID=A0AAN7V3R9_9PEZI
MKVAYIAVVNPDLGGILNLNEVFALGRVMEVKVLENDIRCPLDSETTIRQARHRSRSDDGSVAGQVSN